jgi:hypothetical protein
LPAIRALIKSMLEALNATYFIAGLIVYCRHLSGIVINRLF